MTGDQLWEGDDPMRSCSPCLSGRHDECADLITTPPYGLHACGCTNTAHETTEADTDPAAVSPGIQMFRYDPALASPLDEFAALEPGTVVPLHDSTGRHVYDAVVGPRVENPDDEYVKELLIRPRPVCPECAQGKPLNCAGAALDETTEDFVPCPGAES